MRKFILYVLLAISSFTYAYDWNNYSLSGGVDIMTDYNWRGFNVSGLSVQPWVEFSTHGLNVEVWASMGSGPYDEFTQFVPELDLCLSYTTPDNHFTLGLNHYYYFDGPFFAMNRELGNLGTSQTELEINILIHEDYPFELGAAMMFGGDFYSANGYVVKQNETTAKMLFSTYIYLRYTFEIDDVEIIPEFGFSPNASMYTYYDPLTNIHEPFAVNNVSCQCNYTFYESDIVTMYTTANIYMNFFDVNYKTFEYGKNIGVGLGLGVEL